MRILIPFVGQPTFPSSLLVPSCTVNSFISTIDDLKRHIINGIDLAFSADLDQHDLPQVNPLPADLLQLIESIDISYLYSCHNLFPCRHNKHENTDAHDRMTTTKVKETPSDFTATPTPVTPKRVVLKLNAASSSPNPQALALPRKGDELPASFEYAHYEDNDDCVEEQEAFLWELSTKTDPWTIDECKEALVSLQSLLARMKSSDWVPQQLNMEMLLRNALNNLETVDNDTRNATFDIFEVILASEVSLSEPSILALFTALLPSIRMSKCATCLRHIASSYFALETQLMNDFWSVANNLFGSSDSPSARNSTAEALSNLLRHFIEVRHAQRPDSVEMMTEKLADDIIELILERRHLDIVAKFCQNAFQRETTEGEFFLLSGFRERFHRLLLAVLSGKQDLATKSFAMDRLADVVSSYSISNDSDLNNSAKLATVLLKLVSEDAALIRNKALKMLFALQTLPLPNLDISSLIPSILLRCLQDPSVMVKETSLDLILELLAKDELPNSDILDSLSDICINMLMVEPLY